MTDRLLEMLEMQAKLQLVMPSGDPRLLTGDERAQFLIWNMVALTDEVHEALGETGWKPWATSRHLHAEAMLKEMVDAWHFFMNILLVISAEMGVNLADLAELFFRKYYEKNMVNAQRQADGYDGVKTKCPTCKRELSETDPARHTQTPEATYCSPVCWATSPLSPSPQSTTTLSSNAEAAMARHIALQNDRK